MKRLAHPVSDEFLKLADKFHIAPDRLASICCDTLVAAKPEMLTIISRFAHDVAATTTAASQILS